LLIILFVFPNKLMMMMMMVTMTSFFYKITL